LRSLGAPQVAPLVQGVDSPERIRLASEKTFDGQTPQLIVSERRRERRKSFKRSAVRKIGSCLEIGFRRYFDFRRFVRRFRRRRSDGGK